LDVESMRPIGLDDILGRERYAQARDAIRRRVIDHKRRRRVAVGDRMSLVFEDRATVWYQTQEMLWVEHVTDLDAIRAELDVYNPLLPTDVELAATLLIELREQERIREEFRRLVGLDRHVALVVGERSIRAVFEAGRQTDDNISAVQYVRFPIDTAARTAMASGAAMAVAVDHPSYTARTTLADAVRADVAGSFLDAAAADAALHRVRDGS
jgi:hypothetical protein